MASPSPDAGFGAGFDPGRLLRAHAADYAAVALANIDREFPAGIYHTMERPGDFPPRPRERTAVFFGSFDWHSCVECTGCWSGCCECCPPGSRSRRSGKP